MNKSIPTGGEPHRGPRTHHRRRRPGRPGQADRINRDHDLRLLGRPQSCRAREPGTTFLASSSLEISFTTEPRWDHDNARVGSGLLRSTPCCSTNRTRDRSTARSRSRRCSLIGADRCSVVLLAGCQSRLLTGNSISDGATSRGPQRLNRLPPQSLPASYKTPGAIHASGACYPRLARPPLLVETTCARRRLRHGLGQRRRAGRSASRRPTETVAGAVHASGHVMATCRPRSSAGRREVPLRGRSKEEGYC